MMGEFTLISKLLKLVNENLRCRCETDETTNAWVESSYKVLQCNFIHFT